MRKKQLAAASAVVLCYALLRLAAPCLPMGLLHDVLCFHGCDALAGFALPLLCDFLLRESGHRPLQSRFALLLALGAGLFWELITPLYLPRSVGDAWDVLAVLLGGFCYTAVFRQNAK